MNVVPKTFLVVIAAALFLLLLLPPETYYVQLFISEGAMYALLALSFDICMGFAGLLSLATALYFGLGAYFFVLVLHVSDLGVFLALGPSVLMVLVVALVTGAIAVRVRGPAFLVVTLVLVTASHALGQNWKDLTGGDDGVVLNPAIFHWLGSDFEPEHRYRFALIVFMFGFFATVALVHSPVGRLLRSVKENEFRVELLGYNARSIKMIAFCWAAVLGALAGAIYAVAFQHVHTGMFHWSVSADALIWAFFGGLGSLIGPVIGVAILLPFETYMSSLIGYPRLFSGLLLVIVVLVHKDGLMGILKALLDHIAQGRGRHAHHE